MAQTCARTTRYHLLNATPLAVGDSVKRAAIIGTVGNTGRSTGPHVHLEVHDYGEAIDPTLVFDGAPPATNH